MLISSMKQTSPGRFTLSFDSGEDIKTTLGVITDLRLFPGKEIDADVYEQFCLSSLRSLAREKALEYLSRRPMSCYELRKKLIEKGTDEATAEHCVSWLAENGLISDEDYSAAVVRYYAARGYGTGRIKAELSKRGISREIRDAAIADVPDSSSKIDRFISSRLTDPNDRVQVGKISQALYRRGFSWEEIRFALDRYNAKPED